MIPRTGWRVTPSGNGRYLIEGELDAIARDLTRWRRAIEDAAVEAGLSPSAARSVALRSRPTAGGVTIGDLFVTADGGKISVEVAFVGTSVRDATTLPAGTPRPAAPAANDFYSQAGGAGDGRG